MLFPRVFLTAVYLLVESVVNVLTPVWVIFRGVAGSREYDHGDVWYISGQLCVVIYRCVADVVCLVMEMCDKGCGSIVRYFQVC